MKKIFVLLMVCIVAFCSLSACGSSKITGKWYNANGNGLTINSDGTYKIDKDYGTGKWKILDDKETIQFVDFYGSVTETTVKKDDYGSYIEIDLYGKFYRKQKNSKSNSVSSISVFRAGNFSHGVAWIGYIENDTDCTALINKEGKILYKKENAYPQDFDSVKQEYRFYAPFPGIDSVRFCDESGNTFYEIVNAKGKVISTSKSGEYDSVIACGDNMALVYKDTGSISAESHSFGIIDEHGKWKLKLKELPIKEIESWGHRIKGFKGYYAGCGVFYVEADGQYLINAETGKYAKTDSDEIKFYDNHAYHGIRNTYRETEMYALDLNFKKTPLSGKDNSYITGKFLFCKDDMSITNLETGKVVMTGYKTEQWNGFGYQNGIGLLSIAGKDGNKYFTAFDEDLKMLFEPIQGKITYDSHADTCSFSDKYILFNSIVNNRYQTYIAKTDGTVISEYKSKEDESIYECGIFEDGIAPASFDAYNEHLFINIKGERVLQTLYE